MTKPQKIRARRLPKVRDSRSNPSLDVQLIRWCKRVCDNVNLVVSKLDSQIKDPALSNSMCIANYRLNNKHKAIIKRKGHKKRQLILKNKPYPSSILINRNKKRHSINKNTNYMKINNRHNRDIIIASTSLCFSALGNILYAPLGPISMIGSIYLSWGFIKSGYYSIVKKRKPNVGLLVAINIILFLKSGSYILANLTMLFWSISTKLLTQVENNSKKDFIDVFKKQSRYVWLHINGVEVEVPFASLKQGDIVVVNAGETIPIDGQIVKGSALVDQHLLTGESIAVEKDLDEKVFALTVVLSGKLHIKTEKTGENTTSAKIGKLLNDMVDFKTNMQLRAKNVADQSIWPTLIASGVSYPIYGAAGPLIISASMPIEKLLVPAAFNVLSTFHIASKKGLLIKDGRTLELLKKVDTVVFDKTGTLTLEKPKVVKIHNFNNWQNNDVLTYAAAAEQKQNHPIAKAIKDKASELKLSLPTVSTAEYKIGFGITVSINGQIVRVGSHRFINMENIVIPDEVIQQQSFCHQQGNTLILVAVNNTIIGTIECKTTTRPEAKNVVNRLRKNHGIKSILIISGDHETPTKKLAQKLGISRYYSQVLPQHKAQLIEKLQQEGRSVCYVGDGINDAIALKQANVSISLSGASTVATDTAQVVLMDKNLIQLENLFNLSKTFNRQMENIFSTVMVSSVLAVGGGLFLHMGLLYAIIINQLGFAAGIGISLHSLCKKDNIQKSRVEIRHVK